MPCVHLWVVWINHKLDFEIECGLNSEGERTTRAMTTEDAYRHLFDRCYFTETLRSAMNITSSVVPVSLESIPEPSRELVIKLRKVKRGKGRPEVKRKASSFDSCSTGVKGRKRRQEHDRDKESR